MAAKEPARNNSNKALKLLLLQSMGSKKTSPERPFKGKCRVYQGLQNYELDVFQKSKGACYEAGEGL